MLIHPSVQVQHLTFVDDDDVPFGDHTLDGSTGDESVPVVLGLGRGNDFGGRLDFEVTVRHCRGCIVVGSFGVNHDDGKSTLLIVVFAFVLSTFVDQRDAQKRDRERSRSCVVVIVSSLLDSSRGRSLLVVEFGQ
jgi:hypothetical protein